VTRRRHDQRRPQSQFGQRPHPPGAGHIDCGIPTASGKWTGLHCQSAPKCPGSEVRRTAIHSSYSHTGRGPFRPQGYCGHLAATVEARKALGLRLQSRDRLEWFLIHDGILGVANYITQSAFGRARQREPYRCHLLASVIVKSQSPSQA
jgi:hypothetical protein